MKKRKCSSCGEIYYNNENFCTFDGNMLQDCEERVYSNNDINEGIFTITLKVTDTFRDREYVEDAIRHSCFNEDLEFDSYEIIEKEKINTKDKFPFICINCKEIVTNDTNEWCVNCDIKEWVLR